MNTLYKAYDDITASDAFKQRMVWTLQSEVAAEADDKKVVRFPVKKKTIAILIAAAALVLTIGTAVAAEMDVVPLPKVFSSVITFLKKDKEPEAPTSTTPRYYMGLSRKEREEIGYVVPDIEEAIEAANPESIDYTIEMLPELKIVSSGNVSNFAYNLKQKEYDLLKKLNKEDEFSGFPEGYESSLQVLRDAGYVILSQMGNPDDVDTYRRQMGQPAYSEEDWGWIREIRPEVDEVLIDTNQWSINIRLNTDHGRAFTGYESEPWNWDFLTYHGKEQRVDATCSDAYFTIKETGQKVGLPGYRTGVIENSVSDAGCTLNTQWEVYDFEQNAAYAEMSEYYANKTDGPFPTEGIIQFTMEIALKDAKIDESDARGNVHEGGILGVIRYTFEFDAAAAKSSFEQKVTEIPLSGETILLIDPKDTDRRFNKRVSLDGVVLEETMTYQRTGILVQYTVKSVPDGWTDDDTRGLIDALSVVCKGKDAEGRHIVLKPDTFLSASSDEAYSGILSIFPSEYEKYREMGLKVQVLLRNIVRVDGKSVGEDWVMEKEPTAWTTHEDGSLTFYFDEEYNDSSYLDIRKQTLAEFDLVLP